jgi:hypothetical protein
MTVDSDSFRVLYLGDSEASSTSLQRCNALRSLGHQVVLVDNSPRRLNYFQRLDNWLYRKGLPGVGHRSGDVNRAIRRAASGGNFDILWVDKGVYVTPETIRTAKTANPGLRVVGYSPDYMAARHNNSRWFIAHSKLYDLFVTTKSYAVEWHKATGCKKVLFIGNAYDPAVHRPLHLAVRTRILLGGPVGFIGAYEGPRAAALAYLGSQGVPVRVYTPKWGDQVYGANVRVDEKLLAAEDYARTINSFDINLCFLRAMNLDVQTQRSVEIPACGAFMLAERTAEHQALFKEGVEADFFSDKDELVEKCRFYLARPGLRKRIALAGRKRCVRSGYGNPARLAKVLRTLESGNV